MAQPMTLPLYHESNKRPIAQIELNGYTVNSTGPLGHKVRLHSFRIISGKLRRAWWQNERLQMPLPNGQVLAMRVAALPVDEDSYGMLEILALVANG